MVNNRIIYIYIYILFPKMTLNFYINNNIRQQCKCTCHILTISPEALQLQKNEHRIQMQTQYKQRY
jgi:hypothetical protein